MIEKTIKGMRRAELLAVVKEVVDDISKIKTALSHIEEQKGQASKSNFEINGDENNEGIFDKIKKAKEDADVKINKIREVYTELCGNEENEDDQGLKGELDNLLEEFEKTQGRINSAEKELYGYEEKTEEGEGKHVDGLIDKTKNFLEVQKKKYAETYEKIENELLAGATTVGLSKAYSDKAKSYWGPNIGWLSGFFFSLFVIIIILFNSLQDVRNLFFPEKIADETAKEVISLVSNGSILLEYLIIKLIINVGIISSLIWMACFAGKSYSQNKRLSEEYSYKATFAKSYEGYRKRAEELDQINENAKLGEQLMNKMIEMSAFNPVDTMELRSHKEDHPTMKMLEKSLNTAEESMSIISKLKN